jgi:hypothetical protein
MSDGNFRYRIDDANRIVSVCEDWDEKTDTLDVPAPHASDLVGTSILDHITGIENKQMFVLLFSQCRAVRETMFVQFRCDAPEVRRWMELELRPRDHGHIEVVSRMVDSATRPYVALLDCFTKRSGNVVKICSWCKSVQVGEVWTEVENAVNLLGLFHADEQPHLQQGMCEKCAKDILAQLPPGVDNAGPAGQDVPAS